MRREHWRTLIPLAVALIATSAGCGNLGLGGLGVQPPTADYQDFKVAALSTEAIDFDLGFELANPNAFELPVASLDWNLDLFDSPFSFGQIFFEEVAGDAPDTTSDGGVLTYLGVQSIPAGGALALETPFSVALRDTFEGILRVAAGEDIPYTIGGTLHFDSLFGSWDLPFEASGLWSNEELVAFLEDAGSGLLGDLF